MERPTDRTLRRPGIPEVTHSPAAFAASIKTEARRLGFDACGIAKAGPADPDDLLGAWLAKGYHADMDWMTRTQALRQDPRLKVPGARSIVVVARNYWHPRPAAAARSGRVARYAWGRDYHRVLRKPLRQLAVWIDAQEAGARSYCSIDSGPVLERTWAARAGIGWVGKNSLILRRDLGSWFFLGTIVTTVELAADPPIADHCGSCTACLDACPTAAIVAPQVVDARRCISYQTIENRGNIPLDVQKNMGDWIFGCDICQEVCPWNRFAQTSTESDFLPRPGHAHPDLDMLTHLDAAAFEAEFRGTPLMRTKLAGIQRNAHIAKENEAGGV